MSNHLYKYDTMPNQYLSMGLLTKHQERTFQERLSPFLPMSQQRV